MIVEDKLYGSFRVEPVLEDLITSIPFQRLKGVHQAGAVFLADPSINHTRYEHSIGVLFLVRYMGGSMEEQVAALLHDVSHTAFSHVADDVFCEQEESYHEFIFENVVASSEIPLILRRHGLDTSLLFRKDYSILEQPFPALCADRLDYTLRDLYHARFITLKEVESFLKELVLYEGKIALKSESAAAWIVEKFQVLHEEYFRKPEHVYANKRMAELVRYGLDNSLLTEADLLSDDMQIISTLSRDAYCRKELCAIKQIQGLEAFNALTAELADKQRRLVPTVLL